MKPSRLHGRKVNDYVLRRGKVWKGKHMIIRYLATHPKNLAEPATNAVVYLGTIASAKLDKSAVKRNRMRRRCREAWRLALQEYDKLGPLQLLVGPRSTTLSCAFEDIQKDVRTFLSQFSS